MKKLTAILGLAAALSLAGCQKDPRAQLIKEIENNRTFSAGKYAKFETRNSSRINVESENIGFRDYEINGNYILAIFNLEPEGQSTYDPNLKQHERIIQYEAKEITILLNSNGPTIEYEDTDGRYGFDTKKTILHYENQGKKSLMEVTESLEK
jgi:hypothetical protein